MSPCKLIRVGKIICGTVSNSHTQDACQVMDPPLHNVTYSMGLQLYSQ